MKFIALSPHQDDELLTLGIPIIEAVRADCETSVVLCSDGAASSVRTLLSDGSSCSWHESGHTYDLTTKEFSAARDAEFRSSCLALGCQPDNIIIPEERGKDGQLTIHEMMRLLTRVLSSLVATDEQFVVATISPWVEDQHRDHRAVGSAAVRLFESGAFPNMELRLFCEPYEPHAQKLSPPPIKCQDIARLNSAAAEYGTWQPETNRYAIGRHSVFDELAAISRKSVAYEDVAWQSRRHEHMAIVIGRNNQTCLGACRTLGICGVRPHGIIVDEPGGFAELSAYWAKTSVIGRDGDILKALAPYMNQPYKPIVIAATDASMRLLDENRDELSEHFVISGFSGKQGEVARLMDKKEQEELIARIGGRSLPSCIIDVSSDEPPDIGFPAMLKPLDSIVGDKMHMAAVHNEEEYSTHLGKLREWGFETFLAQRLIVDPNELVVQGFVDSQSGEKAFTIMEKVRTFPDEGGVGSMCRLINDEAAYEYFDSILSGVISEGYSGPIDIDVFSLEEQNGQIEYYLCEINWRASGLCFTDAYTHVDSYYRWFLLSSGKTASNNSALDSGLAQNQALIMCELPDFLRVASGWYSFAEWVGDYRRSPIRGLHWKADPAPWKKEYWNLLGLYANSIGGNRKLKCMLRIAQRIRSRLHLAS